MKEGKYYNPLDQERAEQRAMDQEKAQFKKDELEAELGGEEAAYQRQMSADAVPFYLLVNDVIYRQGGKPKTFFSKKAANNYGLAMVRNRPELAGKVRITKNPSDVARSLVGIWFWAVPSGSEDRASEIGLAKTKSGRWGLRIETPPKQTAKEIDEIINQANQSFGTGRFWKPGQTDVKETSGGTFDDTPKPVLVNPDGTPYVSDRKPYVPKRSMDPGDVLELPNGDRIIKTETGFRIDKSTTPKPRAVEEDTVGEDMIKEKSKPGLWANIHAKRERIKKGSGEKMRRPGSKGAPTAKNFRDAAKEEKEPEKQTPKIKKYTKLLSDGTKKHIYEVVDVQGNVMSRHYELADATNYVKKNIKALESIGSNPTDSVRLDVPLMLRMLEFAREDAKTDLDLHYATERMVNLSKSGDMLTMQNYDHIVDFVRKDSNDEQDTEIREAGGRYWCKDDKVWKDR